MISFTAPESPADRILNLGRGVQRFQGLRDWCRLLGDRIESDGSVAGEAIGVFSESST